MSDVNAEYVRRDEIMRAAMDFCSTHGRPPMETRIHQGDT